MSDLPEQGYLGKTLKSVMDSAGCPSALSFSGGIDSSLLLYLSPPCCTGYTAGINGSRDIEASRRFSKAYGREVREILLKNEDIVEAFNTLRKIDPEIALEDAGYETVLVAVLENIDEEKLITGQGADEIFYGYSKFVDGRETSNGKSMEKLFSTTIPRERKIAMHFGKTLITPYLDERIVKEFSTIERNRHISERGERKHILRAEAEWLGIDRLFAQAPKLASQYGSGVIKEIRKAIRDGIIENGKNPGSV